MKKTKTLAWRLLAAIGGLITVNDPIYRHMRANSGTSFRSRSRYTPHQGKQEIARRKRQQLCQWRPFA